MSCYPLFNSTRKGIILAGGSGSRLSPITTSVSKQLLPVYDKPMIYYPLSTLMLAGIRDVLIITKPNDKESFQTLLGNGNRWGINISYEVQLYPNGIAQAFLTGENFLGNSRSVLILGDNLFHGNELISQLEIASSFSSGSTVFAYKVIDPERYGVIEFDEKGKALSIEEKPINPLSNYAITGLYFYDETVVDRAKLVKASKRGELEITSINQAYLNEGKLNVVPFGRGMTWLDTGTIDSLHQAGAYIRTLEERQGLKICCPEEIAWRFGWINDDDLAKLSESHMRSGYGDYLLKLLSESASERKMNEHSSSLNK